jgi:transcriptional regulator with XRE-family HTH domain
MARLRRRLTAKQVAARAGMAPMTLRSLERGSAAVTVGACAAVMQVLGIQEDLNLVAQADPVGRSLQDSLLPRFKTRRRHSRRPASSGEAGAPKAALGAVTQPSVEPPPPDPISEDSVMAAEPLRKPIEDVQQWIDETDL